MSATWIATDRKPEATFTFAAFLAFLAMLGPFSVDAYLPAFPDLAFEFGASPAHVQQTLTAYFIPFAAMNLLHGTISDAFGRRRALLGALAVYTFASLGCMLADDIGALLMFRAMQGASAGAGVVALYAITSDCFEGADAHRMIAHGTLTYHVAPVVAPVLGGFLLSAFGWRSVFGVLAALGLVMLALVLRRLPETLPPCRRQSATSKSIIASYRRVLRHRDGHLLAGTLAFSFAAGFLYIAASSVFLTRHLGIASTGFAWLFAPLVGGYMLGTFLSGVLASRLESADSVWWGYRLMSLAVGVNVLLSYATQPSIPWSVTPLLLYAIGQSIAAPALKALLLDLFPAIAGAASALRGSVQLLLLAFVSGVIAPLASSSVVGLAVAMMLLFVISGTCWVLYGIRALATTFNIQRT